MKVPFAPSYPCQVGGKEIEARYGMYRADPVEVVLHRITLEAAPEVELSLIRTQNEEFWVLFGTVTHVRWVTM